MIKLFGRIRQCHLSENKIGKYFIYVYCETAQLGVETFRGFIPNKNNCKCGQQTLYFLYTISKIYPFIWSLQCSTPQKLTT